MNPPGRARSWRILLAIVAVFVALRIGFHEERLWCVACGQREINRSLFGYRLSHTVVTEGAFPVERYPEHESQCQVGQHRRSKIYYEPGRDRLPASR